MALPTDPNQLWDARYRLDEYDVLRPDEGAAGVAEFVMLGSPRTHQMLHAWLAPAVERFFALDEENRLGFQDALNRFVRAYSFISQIVSFVEVNLERDYTYCRMLALVLKDATITQALDLGSQVELTHLRHEITYEGSLSLAADVGEVRSTLRDASGKRYEPEMLPLSHIVDVLNEKFGLELGEADKLLFDQFEEDWVADRDLVDQARSNTLENFRLVFDPKFMDTIVGRMDSNQAIFKQILDDPDFKQVLADFYLRKIYHRLRVEEQAPAS